MPLLNPRQVNVVSKAVGAANDVLQVLEPMERFAAMIPDYAQRVGMLRQKRDDLATAAGALLQVHRETEGK